MLAGWGCWFCSVEVIVVHSGFGQILVLFFSLRLSYDVAFGCDMLLFVIGVAAHLLFV